MNLRRFMLERGDKIIKAQTADMKQPYFEICLHKKDHNINEVNNALNNLVKWTEPKYIAKNIQSLFDNSYTIAEPFGVVLIISAWNYPVNLILQPLVGAMAAGNTVVMKPSEFAPNVSSMFARLLPEYLHKECFQVVEGGVDVSTQLLRNRFDKILFTGSSTVGRVVLRAAAEHLTPCILELGGKCPVYIADDADLKIAARRICWAKYTTAGQICIDVDYLICSIATKRKLIPIFRDVIAEFYGHNPDEDNKISRIINLKHFKRLIYLMQGANILIGDVNKIDQNDLYIPPFVLDQVPADHPLHNNEIFGPLMYFRCAETVQQAIDIVNSCDKPLALYVFSSCKETCRRFVYETSSGGVTCNDTFMHAISIKLPFGGVGNSGMGCYHGEHTFKAFSHTKSVVEKYAGMDFLNWPRIPPYNKHKQAIGEYFVDCGLDSEAYVSDICASWVWCF